MIYLDPWPAYNMRVIISQRELQILYVFVQTSQTRWIYLKPWRILKSLSMHALFRLPSDQKQEPCRVCLETAASLCSNISSLTFKHPNFISSDEGSLSSLPSNKKSADGEPMSGDCCLFLFKSLKYNCNLWPVIKTEFEYSYVLFFLFSALSRSKCHYERFMNLWETLKPYI
jgi:hypothetical protein